MVDGEDENDSISSDEDDDEENADPQNAAFLSPDALIEGEVQLPDGPFQVDQGIGGFEDLGEDSDDDEMAHREMHLNFPGEMEEDEDDDEMMAGDYMQTGRHGDHFRRRIMELDMGPDGLEIHWGQGNRPTSLLDDGNRLAPNDEALIHPLLQQRVEVPASSGGRGRSDIVGNRPNIGRSGDLLDWQAFDDAVGGNALQILEQIFSRTRGRAAGSFRIVEVPGGNANNVPGGLVAGVPLGSTDNVHTSIPAPVDVSELTSSKSKIAALHGFKIVSTSDRWKQEARLVYGSLSTDKALRLTNAILNHLVPIAKKEDDERKKKEQEELKAKEEAAKKKAEEDLKKREEEEAAKKKLEEEEAAKKAELEQDVTMPDVGEQTTVEPPGPSAVPAEPVQETERIIVTVNGQPVDITGKLHNKY